MKGPKKNIKEGLRNIGSNLVKEKEVENNVKNEIANEFHPHQKKK